MNRLRLAGGPLDGEIVEHDGEPPAMEFPTVPSLQRFQRLTMPRSQRFEKYLYARTDEVIAGVRVYRFVNEKKA
jgi:hypothetical protein